MTETRNFTGLMPLNFVFFCKLTAVILRLFVKRCSSHFAVVAQVQTAFKNTFKTFYLPPASYNYNLGSWSPFLVVLSDNIISFSAVTVTFQDLLTGKKIYVRYNYYTAG
jgi:hypothetical protein